MAELHERLKAEVKRRGSIKEFTAAMRATGLRGTSKPVIYSYLNGRTSPSYEWLERAAEYLGISTEYLRTGEGHRTMAERLAAVPLVEVAKAAAEARRNVEQVLTWISGYASDLLVERGVPLGMAHLFGNFVAELYEHAGPTAFGVEYDGWKGSASLWKEAPGIAIGGTKVRAYIETRLAPLLHISSHADPWSQKAAMHSVLAFLYTTEFAWCSIDSRVTPLTLSRRRRTVRPRTETDDE